VAWARPERVGSFHEAGGAATHDKSKLERVMPDFTGTKDLLGYVRKAWRWKFLILFFIVAAPAVAYLLELGKPNVYESSALVGVNSTSVNTSTLNSSGSFQTTNVTAIADLVTTSPVADLAAGLMKPPANPAQIVGEVSASGDVTTNFVKINATDRSPQRAAAIANAFAQAISKHLQQSALNEINVTISGLRVQLSHLGKTDPTRPGLQQQLNQLVASKNTQGGEAAILQAATPSSTPAGPHRRRAVELGLLIGILLAIGAVALAESGDRRLRVPEDLEAFTELPLLAAIAPTAFSGSLETGPEDGEAFQMLRTALMYFNVDKPLSSVMITSPGEKDGKTTVATRLGLAAAQAGLNVVLVDGDLRRAQVSSKLNVHTQSGLGALLAGELPLADVLVEYPLPENVSDGRLLVLPAGYPPPNPSALLSSRRAVDVLRELESNSDLVIIDTPAALAVSDPVPLMSRVDGIVIVARMNRSTRQMIRRLQKIVDQAHGTLVGVVATGVSSGPGYEHYYPKYYTSNGSANGSDTKRRLRLRRQPDEPGLRSAPNE
jgi:non-specific protein-tyrosine kinase